MQKHENNLKTINHPLILLIDNKNKFNFFETRSISTNGRKSKNRPTKKNRH